jgi:hypothetical protein
MFNPSRDQARQFLFDAWAQVPGRAGPSATWKAMSGGTHAAATRNTTPVLDDAGRATSTATGAPELGETNPFLHLSMHLAIGEQLAIDQPAGFKARLSRACAERLGDEHDGPARGDGLSCGNGLAGAT